MFPIAFGCCMIRHLPKKYCVVRSILLIVAALLSYFSNCEEYYMLFIASVGLNVAAGRAMLKLESKKARRALLIAAVSADVLVLAGAKVITFAKSDFIMPLGLSFFTFREISYLADLYTGKSKPCDNPIDDVVYITLFTQLQSGPIMQYGEFTNADMYKKGLTVPENINSITNGIQRIMAGFAKKVLIADTLAKISSKAFALQGSGLSTSMAWLGAACFSLQLYYDFSGYSDMAIGMTNIFGYSCKENFNYPYCSGSISEFWRRWHISLGEWFRDYVYFPLGGSRVKLPRVVLNLFVVWLLTGLWHGSSLSFVVWGMIHFVFAAIEHFTKIHKSQKTYVRMVWRIVTVLAIVVGWVMFRANGVMNGLYVIKAMFIPTGKTGAALAEVSFGIYWWVIGLAAVFSLPVLPKLKERFSKGKSAIVFDTAYSIITVVLFVLALALAANNANDTFAYANF